MEANRLGMEMRARGRLDEAARAFQAGVDASPGVPELHLNLAIALAHMSRFDDARAQFARVLDLDPANLHAHWALYELEQVAGNGAAALAHQAAALETQSAYSIVAPAQKRSIAALLGPGDWQANVPVDYLVDTSETTLHKLYLTNASQAAGLTLPRADVCFTAIAQSPQNMERLQWAQNVLDRSAMPCVNQPRNVARADRAFVATALSEIDGVLAPQARMVAREALRSELEFPAVVRPLDSQAGRDLALLRSDEDLAQYLNRVHAQTFYVMPYVHYASADGLFRKYRIFVIGGRAYPCHLGISQHWMVHYYNTPMREHQWMRDEERRFIEHFGDVFGAKLQAAMTRIAQTLELEYLGLDCSMYDGKLLVFEADPAMIVHAADEPELFAYKHVGARAIFGAFAELVDSARSV